MDLPLLRALLITWSDEFEERCRKYPVLFLQHIV